jgi:hypothetical protein
LLTTGSEIGKVFEAELLRHVASYAILRQSGVVPVKAHSVLYWLCLIGQFSPGEDKGQYHVHDNSTCFAISQEGRYFCFTSDIEIEMVPPMTIASHG